MEVKLIKFSELKKVIGSRSSVTVGYLMINLDIDEDFVQDLISNGWVKVTDDGDLTLGEALT